MTWTRVMNLTRQCIIVIYPRFSTHIYTPPEANAEDIWASDISVGGVDLREAYDFDEELDRKAKEDSTFCGY